MDLRHFTSKPFVFDKNYVYKKTNPYKPEGLWVSDESDYGWSQWCIDNSFRTDRLSNQYNIELCLDRILIIKNVQELKDFDENYENKNIPDFKQIDWDAVKKDYSGIIITPYHWETQFRLWYYTWKLS